MKRFTSNLPRFGILALMAGVLAVASQPALAAVSEETAYVFNTFAFLVHGVLVMFMAAGFCMLESGLVRSKNTATICLKNIGLYSVAGIMFYLIGYNLMYVDVTGYIGSFSFLYNPGEAELALINGDAEGDAAIAAVAGDGYSKMSDWFFQMVFVATAASIVSGTVAERIKVWPFIIFTVVLTGIIYPIQASWSGAAAGLPRWASRISPDPPSSTRSAAGRL
jgi:Amt family ammonium transporter